MQQRNFTRAIVARLNHVSRQFTPSNSLEKNVTTNKPPSPLPFFRSYTPAIECSRRAQMRALAASSRARASQSLSMRAMASR